LQILQGQNRPTSHVSDELMGLVQEREQGRGNWFHVKFALHVTKLTKGDDGTGASGDLGWEGITAVDRTQELPWSDDGL